MNIYINGKKTPAQSNLLAVLQTQNLAEKRGIAVAVNNQIVPKTAWTNCVLNENDKVLIIQASQGG